VFQKLCFAQISYAYILTVVELQLFVCERPTVTAVKLKLSCRSVAYIL